jgi:hypothetical protein
LEGSDDSSAAGACGFTVMRCVASVVGRSTHESDVFAGAATCRRATWARYAISPSSIVDGDDTPRLDIAGDEERGSNNQNKTEMNKNLPTKDYKRACINGLLPSCGITRVPGYRTRSPLPKQNENNTHPLLFYFTEWTVQTCGVKIKKRPPERKKKINHERHTASGRNFPFVVVADTLQEPPRSPRPR